jgi:hypothetical protein
MVSSQRDNVMSHISVSVRSLLIFSLLIILSASLPALASADGTPTVQNPYRIYLPIIVKDDAPAQPITVSFQQGSNDYSGVTDTYISSYGDLYAPHGFEPTLAVRWQRNLLLAAESALMRFDLSSIPATATIKSATLALYIADHTNDLPLSISAYGLLRPWEATQANWYSATVAGIQHSHGHRDGNGHTDGHLGALAVLVGHKLRLPPPLDGANRAGQRRSSRLCRDFDAGHRATRR